MKTALFIILGLSLFGCGGSDDAESSQGDPAQDQSQLQDIGNCSSGGGTCRKSQCLANETRSTTLECGHDQGCCAPAPDKSLGSCPALNCW